MGVEALNNLLRGWTARTATRGCRAVWRERAETWTTREEVEFFLWLAEDAGGRAGTPDEGGRDWEAVSWYSWRRGKGLRGVLTLLTKKEEVVERTCAETPGEEGGSGGENVCWNSWRRGKVLKRRWKIKKNESEGGVYLMKAWISMWLS